jgi:hypothetical protein
MSRRFDAAQSTRAAVLTVALGVVAAALGVAATTGKIPLPTLADEQVADLGAYLESHGKSPETYVLEKLNEHDVVFLGEWHCVKHVGEFVNSLIPVLHANGVHVLAIEHARRVDQPLIDSLLAAPEYDESLAREIVFRQFLHHGMQEYVDVFRAAWEVNRAAGPDGPRFHVVGINDAPDWSHVKTRADRDDDAIKRKVWHGESERDWANTILEWVEAGHKVVVHTGMHHAFTEYVMPVVDGRSGAFIRLYPERAGNYVHEAIGKRAITIALHLPWRDARGAELAAYPAGGVIDALMQELGPTAYPVGFDTDRDSPFGALEIPDGVLYARGHDDLTLADWCDGWIFHRPFSEFEGMIAIMDFVNEENLERARAISWDPRFREAEVGMFQWSLVGARNVEGKLSRFE